MKQLSILLAAIVLLNACINRETIHGDGNQTTQTRDAGSFKRIQLMGSMNVEVKKGSERSIEVSADENLLPYILTKLEGDKLVIRFSDDVNINTDDNILIKLTTPTLLETSVMGSGDINGNGKFLSDDKIELNVLGSGNIKMDIDAPSVEAKITGSGNIILDGNTKEAQYGTMGSGNIEAQNLKAETTEAKTTGSGDIKAFASIKLKATITGSGSIAYKGGAEVSSTVHGSGSVTSIND